MWLGLVAAVVSVALTTADPLPAEGDRARHGARRGLPRRGAPRLGRLGRVLGTVTAILGGARVQLVPPAADRPLHDRRRRRTGWRSRCSSSSRSSPARSRRRRVTAPRRPSSAVARPTSPRSWRGCCSAARTSRASCPSPRSASPARSASRRRRSSCARSRATSAGSRSRCARTRVQIGTLLLPAGLPEDVLRRAQERVVPQLEALLAAAQERDALLGDVVETRALRRSDVIKTALLRSVSHDLRSPMTAIVDGGGAAGVRPRRRRGAARARARHPGGGAAAVAAHREPARPLAPGGGRRRAAPRVVLARRGAARRRSTTSPCRPSTFNVSHPGRPAARARRLGAARARLREPAGERRPPLGRASRLAARAGRRATRRASASWIAGPGIPSAQRERVFEPFYRSGTAAVRPSRVGPRAGDRAGLRRGERRDDRGRVPARAGHDVRGRVPRSAPVPAPVGSSAPRRRVLVVDDEPQILRALRVVLRDAGFEAMPASTAQEALDLAALHPPDAAIVDLLLPDGDGIEVTRALREWTKAPIIVLSAVGEEEQKVRALEAGADDYVTKPFGPRELVARLAATLRRATPEPGRAGAARRGPGARSRRPRRPGRRRGRPPHADRVRAAARRS